MLDWVPGGVRDWRATRPGTARVANTNKIACPSDTENVAPGADAPKVEQIRTKICCSILAPYMQSLTECKNLKDLGIATKQMIT